SDGGRFQATNPDASTLTAAPPAAFGFLAAAPARLTVNGSTLTGAPGQTLGLVGGPVSIDRAVLSTPAGKIRLTSALGPGEVPVAPGSAPSVGSYGPIDVNRSLVNISGQSSVGGGKIRLRGGSVALTASEINADNVGTDAGGSIAIRSDGPLALTRGLKMHTDALGTGPGGNISLRAATLTL